MTTDPLAVFRSQFRARALEEADEIEAALACDDREKLERLVHGLAGSAGMFGYPRIGAAAGTADAAFARGDAGGLQFVYALVRTIRSELDPDHS